MAPQPPLHPPHAFGRYGDLPPNLGEPNPLSSNPTFDQAFLMAAFSGNLRQVKQAARVLGRGAEGRRLADKIGAVTDGSGMRLIHYAALGGRLPVCRYLLEDLRLDVNVDGPAGAAIGAGVGRQNLELVRYFLDQGANTENRDSNGCTLLHLATTLGNYEIVKLLLSKGAQVNSLNLGGTALHVAASNGRDDIVKILLDHGADHNIALSATDYTALVLATDAGSVKSVQLLLEAGAHVDGIGKETPLMIAATAGSTDILKCLVLAGADSNVTDYYGRTPIEIAAHLGRRVDVEILFPFTPHLSNVHDWSVDGVIRHVKSVPRAKALQLDPFNATLLSNRSLCWLRCGDAKSALKDAQLCRMMQPDWSKACYREGSALMLLKRGLGILEDVWQ